MEFCPKCGSILVQKKKRFVCPNCSHVSKDKIKLIISEKNENKGHVEVISEKKANVWPVLDARCEKCGNKKAYFWTVQTRSSDEAETRFFKCTKCGTIWRERA